MRFLPVAAVTLVAAALSTPAAAHAAAPAEVIAIQPGDTNQQILQKAGAVVPSARQQEWQRMELTSFHHFGPNTFTGREWGTGTEDPDVFNPSELDTDQWMRTLRDAGFKQAILTAKHHDGFLLYPTRYSRHSVKESSWQNGRGDVVRSFVDSARRHGLKVGFYLSPADLHEAQPGGRFGNNSPLIDVEIPEVGLDGTRPDGPRFPMKANDYNRFYLNTMYELLTEYGQIDEVWWDGADAVGGNKERFVYADWIRMVRTLQPEAVIFQDGGPDVRWVGNESGIGRVNEHSVLPYNGPTDPDRMTKPDNNSATDLGSDALITQRNSDGTPRWDGLKWLPAECDTHLGPGWFWHEGQSPNSLSWMQDVYFASVGRNCQLLLNIAPDKHGRLPDADVERLREFHQWRTTLFDRDIARGANATADTGDAGRAVDGNADTYWQPTRSTGTLTANLGASREISVVGVQESMNVGQRVTSFGVDAWVDGAWQQVATGGTVGYKRLVELNRSVTTSQLRLRVTSTRGNPAIASFTAHHEQKAENLALGRPARQSTTHDAGGPADKAVDGNTNGGFFNGSVTHTSDTVSDPNPWWQVDLGSSQQIGSISIFNRTDCCANRLSDYWVIVSDNPSASDGWMSHQTVQAGTPTTIPVGAQGRYVTIWQSNAVVLSLAEVEVFS